MAATGQGRSGDTLTRGSLIGILAEVLILPTGLLTAAILTRTLGLESYGLVGVVIACVTPVAWIAASVLGQRAGVRLVAGAGDPVAASSGMLRASMVIGAIGALIFAAAAPLVAGFLGKPGITGALIIAAGEVFLLPVARTHRDCLTATGRFSHAALAAAVFHVTRLVGVVVLVMAGLGVEAVLCAILLARLAEIAWCRQRMAIPLLRRSGLGVAEVAVQAVPVFVHQLGLVVISSADILFLATLGATAAVLSYYGAAQVVALTPALVLTALVPGVIAVLSSRTGAGLADEAAAAARYAWRLVSVGAALLLVGAGGAPTIMGVLFGRDFAPGADVLAILLIGGVGTLVTGISVAILVGSGRSMRLLWIGFPAATAALVLHPHAIDPLGGTGAAAVTSGVRLGAGIVALLMARHLAFDGLRSVMVAVLAGLSGAAAAWVLGQAGLPVLDLALGSAVALAVLYAGGIIDRSTLQALRASVAAPAGSTPESRGNR